MSLSVGSKPTGRDGSPPTGNFPFVAGEVLIRYTAVVGEATRPGNKFSCEYR